MNRRRGGTTAGYPIFVEPQKNVVLSSVSSHGHGWDEKAKKPPVDTCQACKSLFVAAVAVVICSPLNRQKTNRLLYANFFPHSASSP